MTLTVPVGTRLEASQNGQVFVTAQAGQRAWALLVALYLAGIVSANALASKLIFMFGISVTTGALAIPLVYLTTDMINELYGAEATRRVVWMGFIANVVLVCLSAISLMLPASPYGASQQAFATCFSQTPRIVVASMFAYLVSSFIDVAIFAWLRRLTREKHFWLRKNGSTVVSQFVDSGLFASVAFIGVIPLKALAWMVLGQYMVKIIWAPLGTPLSYVVLKVARMK